MGEILAEQIGKGDLSDKSLLALARVGTAFAAQEAGLNVGDSDSAAEATENLWSIRGGLADDYAQLGTSILLASATGHNFNEIYESGKRTDDNNGDLHYLAEEYLNEEHDAYEQYFKEVNDETAEFAAEYATPENASAALAYGALACIPFAECAGVGAAMGLLSFGIDAGIYAYEFSNKSDQNNAIDGFQLGNDAKNWGLERSILQIVPKKYKIPIQFGLNLGW